MMGLVMPTAQALPGWQALPTEQAPSPAPEAPAPAPEAPSPAPEAQSPAPEAETSAWEALQSGWMPWAQHVPSSPGREGASDAAEEEEDERDRSSGSYRDFDAARCHVVPQMLRKGGWKDGVHPVRIEGRKWLFFSVLKLDC